MLVKKLRETALATAAAGALVIGMGVGTANAVSATNALVYNELNTLSDQSAETIKIGIGNGDAVLDMGEVLRGYAQIGGITNSAGSFGLSTADTPTVFNEMTVLFEFEVIGKTSGAACATGNFCFAFGPTASFQAELAGLGFAAGETTAVAAFFNDTNGADWDFDDVVSVATLEANTTDGSALWLFGLDGIDDFWSATTTTDDTSLLPTVFAGGNFNFAATLLQNPTGPDLISYQCIPGVGPTADVCGNGNLTGSTNPNFDAANDVNFFIIPVAEPGTLGIMGLGLLGLGLVARRRRNA